jgi:hypothetical protein
VERPGDGRVDRTDVPDEGNSDESGDAEGTMPEEMRGTEKDD